MKHKKITLFGFYGRKNSGDDAMLYGILKYLSEKSIATVYVPSDIEIVLPVVNNNIVIIPRNIKSIFKSIKQSDYLLIGGGSLFHTKGKRLKFKIMVSRIFALALSARIYKCKVSFISAGIGPFENAYGRMINKFMLNCCDFINVRDVKSYDLILKAGYPKSRCSLTTDFAYAITPPPGFASLPVEDKIAINLLPYCTEYSGLDNNDTIIETYKTIIKSLLENGITKRIDLICINAEEDVISGDKPLLETLYKEVNDDRVQFVPYSTDPLQMMQKIKSAKLFVTFRYHGIVYAHITGVPCAALEYHTKSEMLIKAIDRKEIAGFPLSMMENPSEVLNVICKQLKMEHFEPDNNNFNLIIENSFPENYFR